MRRGSRQCGFTALTMPCVFATLSVLVLTLFIMVLVLYFACTFNESTARLRHTHAPLDMHPLQAHLDIHPRHSPSALTLCMMVLLSCWCWSLCCCCFWWWLWPWWRLCFFFIALLIFSRLHSSDASNLVGTIPQRASRKSLGCPSRIMIGTRSMMRSRDELLQMLAKHSMHASTLSEPHGYGWLRMWEDRWCRAHERDIDDHIIMMIMRVVGGGIFIFRHNVNGVARTKIWRLNPGKKGGHVMG